MIAKLAGDGGKHFSDSIICRSLGETTCLRSDAPCCRLFGDRNGNGPSTQRAHVLQTRDGKFLVFGEQVLIALTKTHHESGHTVLVDRRFHFVDELPARSHSGVNP